MLFIIGDGIPADLIETNLAATLKKLGPYRRAYVGGENGSYSSTWTISAPGYMSLLTGTWGHKHNVFDNDVKEPNYHYRNLFRLLKETDATKTIGIFSTWIDNRVKLIGEGLNAAGKIRFDYQFDGYELDPINYPHDPERFFIHQIDERVTNETCRTLEQFSPDLSWVYLEYTDDMGHRFGDSEQFNRSIVIFDQQVERITKAIEHRQKRFNEEWLVIVTTDHGRDSLTGQDHGDHSERERTTWIVTNYPSMNDYFHRYQPGIVDIFPTITRFLQMTTPLDIENELDGVALIGKVSLIHPEVTFASSQQLTVKWQVLDRTGDVGVFLCTTNLFKDGLKDNYVLVATVPIFKQMITVNISKYPSNFYKILLRGRYNSVNRWILRS